MTQSKILKIILVVIIVVALFWGSEKIENYFQTITNSLATFVDDQNFLGIISFMVLATLSVMFVAFSSVWLVPIAQSIWGNTLTLVLLLGGWLIGGILAYLVGRYAGYPIVRKIVSNKKLENYHKIFKEARQSFNLVILSRLVLPSEIPGYLFGILKYPFVKYLTATLIGEIPYAVVTVYFIDAILKKNLTTFLIWGAVWIIFAFLMIGLYKKITINNKQGTSSNLR